MKKSILLLLLAVALAGYASAQCEKEISTNAHKRLPGMPSAEEVAETVIEMGKTVRLLTEKIEEITLYLIELKQENDALKAEIEALKGGN